MPLEDVLFWLIVGAVCLLLLRAGRPVEMDMDVSDEARDRSMRR
jgi:hypothetical protein